MARTTPGDVRAELERTDFPTAGLQSGQITTVGIDPAHLKVTEDLASTGMSEERLELIERYLAGALILMSGIDDLRQTTSERTDREQKSFTGEFGEGWKNNTLGQKALAFDESGTLANDTKPTFSLDVPSTKGGN